MKTNLDNLLVEYHASPNGDDKADVIARIGREHTDHIEGRVFLKGRIAARTNLHPWEINGLTVALSYWAFIQPRKALPLLSRLAEFALRRRITTAMFLEGLLFGISECPTDSFEFIDFAVDLTEDIRSKRDTFDRTLKILARKVNRKNRPAVNGAREFAKV